MANSLLSPDADQDEALNKGQQHYDERFAQIAAAEDAATFDDIANNNSDLRSAEEEPSNPMNYTGGGGSQRQARMKMVLAFARTRGGLIGLLAILGIGGGFMGTILGPASMLLNLSENISIQNDSSSTAMERRFMKIFANMTSPDNDTICANSTKNIKCRMGRISNSALYQLNKKGVTAVDANGNEYDGKTKRGYPDKNPSRYIFDIGDGNKRVVNAENLAGFLANKENRKYASLVLGNRGAFNLRTKAWMGKHINEKLFKKFNIGRSGGVTEGGNGGRKTPKERLVAGMEKLREKIPGMESADKVSADLDKKVDKHLNKANKGGVAYLSAVAGCIGIRAPGYIASGVAAVQLMQVMPYFMETIGSPASKAKQSAIGSGFTAEDADTTGTILTNKVNGKSALDSQVLLAAAGINKGKPAVPKNAAPGFAALTNSGVLASKKAADASEEACNAIMSPAAMYTAMAVDTAVTAATSATLVGAFVKIGVSLAVSAIVTEVTKGLVGDLAKNALVEFAKNDAIPKAEGEELGDVIGVSAMAFFSTGGLSRHLPVLTKSQAVAFEELKNESEQLQKEMDIASLSPFDISSRHTFLGSIVYNTQTAVLANGALSSGSSLLSTLARLPITSLSPNVSAVSSYSEAYCGYAKDFQLETEDPSTIPCITASGLPGVGITPSQASMESSTAIERAILEGWINEDLASGDSASIQELVSKGDIKPDTPLYEFIETCSNPEDGGYLYSAAGCTAPAGGRGENTTADGQYSDVTFEEGEVSNVVQDLNHSDSLTAMTPFLLDYQIIQSINGEDEETGGGESESAQGSVNTDGFSFPVKASKGASIGVIPCDDPSGCHGTGPGSGDPAFDIIVDEGTPVFAIESGSISFLQHYSGTPDICKHFVLDGSSGAKYWYGHIINVTVSEGGAVSAGQQIAVVGPGTCTRGTSVPHLHIDKAKDPTGGIGAIGNLPNRDPSFVPLMNQLYMELP